MLRKMKFLTLAVTRTGKGLDGIRRKNEQRAAFKRSVRGVRARELRRIAIHLGGGLRAHKATSFRADAQIEPGFIAGHQAAAEIARIGPNTFAACAGCE